MFRWDLFLHIDHTFIPFTDKQIASRKHI
jgi:hypothetical protein